MIEINNLTNVLIDEKFLKKICQRVLEGEHKKDLELSVALVGQSKIRELNKKYRNKDKVGEEASSPLPRFADACVTDVLSFQYDNSAEIVICLKEVKKNAKKDNITFEKELTKVIIHGILHALRYDHEKSKKEAEKMREKEESYLEKLQITSTK